MTYEAGLSGNDYDLQVGTPPPAAQERVMHPRDFNKQLRESNWFNALNPPNSSSYGDNPLTANPGKASRWNCVKCGHDNKAVDWSCVKCGHEPTMGRRDVDPEGRKYTPGEEEQT